MKKRVALLAALFLAGCGSPTTPGIRLFDPVEHSEDADGKLPIPASKGFAGLNTPSYARTTVVAAGESVVVIGVSAIQERGFLGSLSIVESGWINVDPATGFRALPVMPEMPLGLSADYYPPDGRMNYLVYTLPPGTYALGWVGHGRSYYLPSNFERISATVQLNHPLIEVRTRTVNRIFTQLAKAEPVAPTFELKPGETLYVGDVVLDLSDQKRLTWRQERNDEAARAALKAHDGIHSDSMTTRLWHRFDGKPPGANDGIALDSTHMSGEHVVVQ
jgi:hypothetical protein